MCYSLCWRSKFQLFNGLFMMEKLDEEARTFLAKVIIPALVAISVKLALQSKRQKVSLMNVVTSIIIGIGSAYLSSDWVLDNFGHGSVPIVIGTITITSEKIGYWLLDRFDVGGMIDAFMGTIWGKMKK